jgi:anti-sigma B factor antagonist
MQINDFKVADILIIQPMEKRIDATSASIFKSHLIDLINSGKKHIILDLSELDFIDSSGLSSIVSSFKAMDPGTDFVLCCLKDTVKRPFHATKLDRIFKIYTSREDAVKAISV